MCIAAPYRIITLCFLRVWNLCRYAKSLYTVALQTWQWLCSHNRCIILDSFVSVGAWLYLLKFARPVARLYTVFCTSLRTLMALFTWQPPFLFFTIPQLSILSVIKCHQALFIDWFVQCCLFSGFSAFVHWGGLLRKES